MSNLIEKYRERLKEIAEKRKALVAELSTGPSEFVRSLVENINIDDFDLPNDDEKFYSNDLADSVHSNCKICGIDVRLNQMRQHTRKFHDVAIKDYISKFGNPRNHIVKHVYHKCGECCEEILFDADSVHLHVMKHTMSLHDYTEKYLKKVRKKRRGKKRVG